MINQPAARIKALDLFAGTGWGVACQRLGIKEAGVEIMPEAVDTRTANGMETIYRDVWDGLQLSAEEHRQTHGSYGLLIASPPCQTFSLAGRGAGRAALDEVLKAIELHAYKDPAELLAFGEKHDMRTALVLVPLAYVWRDRPRIVALEQVPTVLPVWEACAAIMREWGYEVKVQILNAEQYGVPQTRKRAILVARRGGTVTLPTPTHSRYYSRNPDKLDPGMKKWVSMAEALGWGAKDQPSHTITGGNAHGPDRWASGGASVRGQLDEKIGGSNWIDKPDQTVDSRTTFAQRFDVADVAALQTYPQATVRTSMGRPKADERNGSHELDPYNRPAHTLTSKSESWLIKSAGVPCWEEAARLTAAEAAALQTYPPVFQAGHRPNAARRPVTEPAPTIIAGHDIMNRGFLDDSPRGVRTLTPDEAAALQSYPSHLAASGTSCQVVDPRPTDHPAPTITGAGTAEFGNRPTRAVGPRDRDPEGRRLTPEEAAALQTFPIAAWGFTDRPAVTVGNAVGRGLIGGSGAKETVVRALEDGTFIPSPHGDGMDYANQTRITVEEAAVLQSYPVVQTNNFTGSGYDGGDRVMYRRTLDAPCPTVNSRADLWRVIYPTSLRSNYGTGGDASNRGERGADQPAPTLTSKADRNKWDGMTKMSVEEAAALQTYLQTFERPFVWCGTKTKQFLQIGNAVPPLLAEHILAALIGIPITGGN